MYLSKVKVLLKQIARPFVPAYSVATRLKEEKDKITLNKLTLDTIFSITRN